MTADGRAQCVTCGGVASRKVVINAFHRMSDARLEAPRCDNALLIPVDYNGMVNLVQRFADQGPIHELEIAAHGTPEPQLEGSSLYVPAPTHPRWSRPGAAILGQRGELVSGMSIETNSAHAASSRRLGACVIPGGIITWQCCNLGYAWEPYRDFLTAFSRLAPHLASVTAGMGPTLIGTPGLQGTNGFTGYRAATAGTSGPVVPEQFPGFLPDQSWPAARPLAPIVEDLGRPRRP